MVSVPARLIPSMISISPDAGQLGPKSQKAGQIPQASPGLRVKCQFVSKMAAFIHYMSEKAQKGKEFLHVSNISNVKTMGICLVASHSNRVSTWGCWVDGGVVNTKVDLVIGDLVQSISGSDALAHIIDVTRSWVRCSKERKVAEEVAGSV